MLNLSDFNFHGHQGKQLKAYEVQKEADHKGKKITRQHQIYY